MLTNANIRAQCVGYMALVGPTPDRRTVSYLPMAHVAERMVTHYGWLWQRTTVTCCPDQSTLVAYLVQVRPTDLFGPPRVFEKLKAGIEAAVAAAGPEKAAGFEQARAVGRQVAELRAADRPLPPELAAAWEQLDAAVFAPIRRNVGLDQLNYCFSGAAPLPVDVMHFLRSIGLPFSEVYGMSENTGGDDLGAVPGEAGHGRQGAARGRGAHRRGRRGARPRRDRLARLPGRPGAQRGDLRRRRLAAHRRHRQPRRGRLPVDRGPEEGADHHRRRQEHLAGQPGGAAEVAAAGRPGLRGRRRAALPGRAARARPRGRAGLGRRGRACRPGWPSWPPPPRSGPSWSAAWPRSTRRVSQVEGIKKFASCRTSGCPTPRSSPRP